MSGHSVPTAEFFQFTEAAPSILRLAMTQSKRRQRFLICMLWSIHFLRSVMHQLKNRQGYLPPQGGWGVGSSGDRQKWHD